MDNTNLILKSINMLLRCKGNSPDFIKSRLVQSFPEKIYYTAIYLVGNIGIVMALLCMYLLKPKRVFHILDGFIIEDHSSLVIVNNIFGLDQSEIVTCNYTLILNKSIQESLKIYFDYKRKYGINNQIDNSLVIEISFWIIFYKNIFKNTKYKLPVIITDDVTTRSISLAIMAKLNGKRIGLLVFKCSICETCIASNIKLFDLLFIGADRHYNFYSEYNEDLKFARLKNEDEILYATNKNISARNYYKKIGILPGYGCNYESVLVLVEKIKETFKINEIVIKLHPREKMSNIEKLNIEMHITITSTLKDFLRSTDLIIAGNTGAVIDCFSSKIPIYYHSSLDNYGEDFSEYVANGILPQVYTNSLRRDIDELVAYYSPKKWSEINKFYGFNGDDKIMSTKSGLKYLVGPEQLISP